MSKNKKDAINFYNKILGFKILYEFQIPEKLSYEIFKIQHNLNVMVFGNSLVNVEIFIFPGFKLPEPNIPHICITVEDLEIFLKIVKKNNIEIIIGESEGRKKYFIKDFSGNLFEIKSEGKG
ncbi:VOC family protein [Candidatus Dependentiae bacterium]|nr:VOC family protein [Candidatus Dependentiae bacterium]